MTDPRVAAVVERAGVALAEAARAGTGGVVYREEGRVVRAQDGVLTLTGLPGVRCEELLRVGQRSQALVLGLTADRIRAVVLGATDAVQEGDRARTTGKLASVAVGPSVEGRVIDPLGRPLDGRPLSATTHARPMEAPAPPIHARAVVHTPLYTGILGVDAMFPIGRGQRELILGDEGTGKTSLALTALVRQASTDVIGVYVGIGRRRAELWRVVETLRKAGGRWVVVAAPEDASPGLRYLAPYAATAVAEFFRDRGEHVLVVYDELTAHAVAWRELSLLLERPPGREAFPGDVFYLHARLLERATQLSSAAGGGSITALPIATTEDGRLSAYIPTNLISITDGQIVLSRSQFAAGHKPAVDAGLSVSRVGGKAQASAFRRLSSRLRLDYASFLELESFARVGTRLEDAARRRLELGRRLRLLLRAPRLHTLGVVEELVLLELADDADTLLRVPEVAVASLVTALPEAVLPRLGTLADRLARDPVLTDEDHARMRTVNRAYVDERWPAEAEP